MSVPLPDKEARRIEALRHYHILDTPPEKMFDDVALLASIICQTPIASMTLVDTNRQWSKARIGLGAAETPREHGFCAHTILSHEMMVIEDAKLDDRFAQNPFVTSSPHIRFYAGAPLIDKEGNALGSLCVIDGTPRNLGIEQRAALEALSRQIIALLELRNSAAELAEVLVDLNTLRGLLPICSHCKNIRDDKGYWESVESYVTAHADVKFSHGICPDCVQQYYPEVYEQWKAIGEA